MQHFAYLKDKMNNLVGMHLLSNDSKLENMKEEN